MTLPQKISAGPLLPSMVKSPKGGQTLGFAPFSVPSKSNVAKVQFGLDSGFSQTGEWVVG